MKDKKKKKGSVGEDGKTAPSKAPKRSGEYKVNDLLRQIPGPTRKKYMYEKPGLTPTETGIDSSCKLRSLFKLAHGPFV